MGSIAYSKSVFISFAPEDARVAERLRDTLETLIGPSVWMRTIELKSGTLIAEAVNSAISSAKWFILLISSHSLSNAWIKMEANLATLRAIEDENFAVVLIRVDETPMPPHIQRVVNAYRVVQLEAGADFQDEFLNLAVDINQLDSTRSQNRVYVDRGQDADQVPLLARRQKVIVVVGWAGIGKSAFVRNSVTEKLGKDALTVTLTRSHSVDMLCRQILHEARVPQPIGPTPTDSEWMSLALNAIDQRANNFFLFIDNAEEAVDPAAQFLPSLQELLTCFCRSTIRTHIVLATTRMPDIIPEIGADVDFLHLDRMADNYIQESIDLWLEGNPRHASVMASPELRELITYVGGHPLAAKMVSSLLKSRTPAQLLESNQAYRIQLKLAEYMLRAANHGLTENHRLFLQVLAGIGEPVLLQDMTSVRELAAISLNELQAIRWDLADWFLVEQRGDLIYLSKSFAAYFRDQLNQHKGRFETVASDFGIFALERALEINKTLLALPTHVAGDQGEVASLSGEIFRYAVPSARLLRAVGKESLADQLPIEIRGTLREMVFHFFQVEKDYRKALSYADQWLTISPGDLDVLLYSVRCYRNIGGTDALANAEKLIRQLEKREARGRFTARIWREKALIAERRGDLALAKTNFRQGIDADRQKIYPDNHVGLAQIMLRELDELPPGSAGYTDRGREALRLLSEARDISSTFDRFHIGLYVEALIQVGDEDAAMPLLRLALQDRPDDSRLNYRMAEILRRRDNLKDAEIYAVKATRFGAKKATLTLANIYFTMGTALQSSGVQIEADEQFRRALSAIEDFAPEYGHDREVADGLASKIMCAIGDLDGAASRIMKYTDPSNPYTVYEQCRVDLKQAEREGLRTNYADSTLLLRRAVSRIEGFSKLHTLSTQLEDLLFDLRDKISKLQLG